MDKSGQKMESLNTQETKWNNIKLLKIHPRQRTPGNGNISRGKKLYRVRDGEYSLFIFPWLHKKI